MNIYYVPPSQIQNGVAELTGQEARHASKVMRVRGGDAVNLVDGTGGSYEGKVSRVSEASIQVEITKRKQLPKAEPELILGMGIIKKRDRLEFAVEKAVELGASRICLFRSEHTVKQNVRLDRLESKALSAMKQSLRARLPEVLVFDSLEQVVDSFADARVLAAHQEVEPIKGNMALKIKKAPKVLLLVGPEGGFSSDEIEMMTSKKAQLVSLGSNRLRAETAAIAFLSQFLN